MDETLNTTATTEGAGEHVRLPADLVAKLRVIRAHRRRPMNDLVVEYAGPAIAREYRRVLDEMQAAELGGEA